MLRPAVAMLLSTLAVAPAFAQVDPDESDLFSEVPDLLEVFKARPPMGDCPLGEQGRGGPPAEAHLLHLGVPRFFRDHRQRLGLRPEQVEALQKAQEQALRSWSTHQARIDELERTLWQLTGAPSPSMAQVEEAVAELSKARGEQRLDYIRAVVAASGELTPDQVRRLVDHTKK